MDQQQGFVHRGSVPTFSYQHFGSQAEQMQPRSFSVSNTATTPIPTSATLDPLTPQWRSGHIHYSTGLQSTCQQQQQPQYHQMQDMQDRPGQGSNINTSDIVGEVGDVLQRLPSNDAPYFPGSSQQHAPFQFHGEQFRMQSSGALTEVPYTHSQHPSFADSGYVSQSPQKRLAIFDDSYPDLAGQYQQQTRTMATNRSPKSAYSDSLLHTKKARRTPGKLFRCPRAGCDKVNLKNESDLKKHTDQHDKPHRCNEPGCEREEGFGTTNDLERHRACVHNRQQRCGTTAGYICFACERQLHTRKWWPRKDNFKSHIRRKHAEWPEDQLVERSKYATRPADTLTELLSATSHHEHDEDRLRTDFSNNPVESYQPEFFLSSPGNEGEILAGGGQWTDIDSSAIRRGGQPGAVRSFDNSKAAEYQAIEMAQHETSATDSVHRPMGGMIPKIDCASPNSITQFQPNNTLAWNQQSAGSQSTAGSFTDAGLSAGLYKCSQCSKVKKRACDLRKHEKRHTRPYGCTFPRCFKRFGSRNDWKRHENTQHQLKDQWRCRIPNQDGSACAKLFHALSDMSAHLDIRHGHEGYHHDSTAMHFEAIERAHLGHEGHYHFWCGFCSDLIPQKKIVHRGHPDPRFQHIGDHFDKNHLTIDDWVDIEENKKKRFITPPKSKRQSSRDSSADESDLGDDGIPGPAAFVTGYTAPISASSGFARATPMRGSMYTANKHLDLEDAEGESDYEFSRRMI